MRALLYCRRLGSARAADLLVAILGAALLGAAPPVPPVEPEPKAWTLEALQAAAQVADPRVLMAVAELARQHGVEAQVRAEHGPALAWNVGVTGPVGELRNDPNQLDSVSRGSRLRNGDLGGLGFTGHLGANLTWPLYGFGRYEAYRGAAAHGVAASAEAARAARQTAARDTAQIYWDYQLARRVITSLDELDRQLAGAHERIEHLMAQTSSHATRQDLAQLELVRAELASRRAEAIGARDASLETARMVAGVAPEAPFTLASAALDPPVFQLAPLSRFTEIVLGRRAEIAAAQETLRNREGLALARRRAFYPELVAGAFADLNWTPTATAQTNPFAWDPYNHLGAGIGLALRGTVDVGRSRAEVAQAEAEVERARAELEQATRAVRLEITRAHAAARTALERVARLRDEEAAARRWLAEAEGAFEAGQSSAQAVLLAAVATGRAGTERFTAGRDALVALADLALATGEDPRAVGATR